ncbi:sodium-coupled neutral amino acid transporter 1 [Sesamum indicum]|uniref:Sodium-coupled neutral amino acid transporter 1 n=1 Tax=Sesamum indicum TaxID=4182 RepID=A0A6I9TGL3_SESIN|nr:sodium-coupled neutral amino acid transporter 1 [Sesamum indicum]
MDSNYSKLQVKDGNYQFKDPSFRLYSPDHGNGYLNPPNADDLDVEDVIDLDELPFIFGERKSGSGIYGAVFNLTTSVIGAGLMALPATMKVLGLILGVILIFLMGILSEISVEFLVRFSVQSKAATYGEVVQAALGRTARTLSEICIIINNAGVLVVYLIIIGDVMSGSLRHMGVLDQWWGHGFWDHRKIVILVVLVLFLAPLCALDKIDSLSTTSAASVALAVVYVVVAFIIAAIKLAEGKIEPPRMSPDFGSWSAILDFLVVIPIMSNAYVCHFNVQPIYNELEEPSPHKMYRIGRITTIICVLIYASTAIAGYLLFGKDTESDVLTNFDKDLGIRFSTALNYIVRIGYVLHLILVFPVVHFSLRQTVDTLIFEGLNPLSESRKRCLVITFVILGLIYLGSTTIPNIWTAFKFTGATTAVSLGFTFPSLIALRLSKVGSGLSQAERFLSWLMLTLAIIVSIAGVIGNIYTFQSN